MKRNNNCEVIWAQCWCTNILLDLKTAPNTVLVRDFSTPQSPIHRASIQKHQQRNVRIE
jgi:hypothetical protein